MANRDFEIDLRMKADFSAGDRAINTTDANLKRIIQTTSQANREIVALSSASPAANGIDAQTEAAGTQALNAALGQNAQSRQAIAAASRATQQAVSAEIGLISELQARLARGAGSYDDLADTEARLDQAMRKGLISTEEYEQALASLNGEQQRLDREAEKAGRSLDTAVGRYDKAGAGLQRLARDEQRLKDAVDQGRISREQYNRAMATIGTERARLEELRNGATNAANAMRGLNLQALSTQQNIAQLVRFGATGQWQAAGTQLLSLGGRAGVVGSAFSVAGVAVLGATAALVGVGAAAVTGYLQMRALETTVIATGNAAGVTAGGLARMRNEIGESTGQFADAQKAMVLLASSGVLTSDSLESAGRAAVNLSLLTGRSVEETTADIIRLAKAPTAGLLELNERYHFLTEAVYDQVRSLEDQGRAQDAVAVGLAALAGKSDTYVQQMRDQAGLLEKAWISVSTAIKSAFQRQLDFGRTDAEGQLLNAQRAVEDKKLQIDQLAARGHLSSQVRESMERELAVLKQQVVIQQKAVNVQEKGAKSAGDAELDAANTLRLKNRLQDEYEAHLDRETQKKFLLKKLETEILGLSDRGVTQIGELSLGDYQVQRTKQIELQFTESKGPKAPKAPKGPKEKDPDEAAKRELQNLERQIALLYALADGETKAGEAARIRFEIEQGAFKGSSDAIKARLVDSAQALDEGRRKLDIAKQLKDVNLEILRLQGEDAAAAVQEVIDKLAKLRAQTIAQGDTAATASVDKLIGLTRANAELDELQRRYQIIQENIGRAQQRIDLERQAGLISEAEAQRRVIDLYSTQGTAIEALLPRMEALAAVMGGPAGEAARRNLEQIRFELEQMRSTTDLLQQRAGEIFEGSFANALESLATRAKNLKEAVTGFIVDMARGLAQFASQQLAQLARAKIFSLFNKGPDLQNPNPAQAAAAGAAYAAPIGAAATALTASAGPLAAAAAALSAAATKLAAAGAASSGGGGGGDAAGGAGAYVGLLGSLLQFAFADGGHVRGPGTSTSDSIIAQLSNNEYVLRAAVVQQPGMLGLLDDLNNRGVRAVADWQHRFAFAPAMPSLPSVPRYRFADGGLAQAVGGAVQNNFRFMNFFDIEDFAQAVARSPHFEKGVLNVVDSNSSRVRGSVGGRR